MDEFFALMFKSVKADKCPERVLAFVRRIIQMATINDARFTAACLLILSELVRVKSDLRFQLYSLEQISGGANKGGSDDDEEHFVDADKVAEDAAL